MTDEETMDPDYNYSDYILPEYEAELCHKEEVVKFGSIIIPVFFTIVVLLSCIGNILVLVILALYENLKSLTNIFILNVALSDLLFTFGLPFWASYYIWGWTFGEIGCKAVKFLFDVGLYSSVLFLTLMTIQRYMAVVHPLSDWEKCRGFSAAPIIIWILSGVVSLPNSLYSEVTLYFDNTFCEYDSVKVKFGIVYFQNSFFFIAFLIMGFCCGRMLWSITKSQTNEKHKTVRLTFVIALVFFIGWAPYNIVMLLNTLTDQNIKPFTECEVSIRLDYAYHTCRTLAFSNCCLNPLFYIFVDVKFRNHLKMILQKIFK
ncbi:chemokine XC receptor 1-like [Megalobrama amblycephala]|uniref:chemokine XC receptor 1-like n=1 Tax=Megalobrama amblycephala TaxID=75352 RepID=UPI0020141BC7|nr:chemokine XC receptor 1-like [Megalobrama amblycephala]XP_048033980.1 chemokine XC receptor 1-like [Megalobrama amblycephala]XP_048033981.1 chemokine XC receptor 1-like [Megalobrama amblycephala]XP_048033982.1 chemokine XC receptor 1-like [Megalobrama amblycephala]